MDSEKVMTFSESIPKKSHKVILHELVDSYLYKDILNLDMVAKPDKLNKLIQALAYQIGSQVSYNELA